MQAELREVREARRTIENFIVVVVVVGWGLYLVNFECIIVCKCEYLDCNIDRVRTVVFLRRNEVGVVVPSVYGLIVCINDHHGWGGYPSLFNKGSCLIGAS